MKALQPLLLLLLLVGLCSGCSVYMASNLPPKRDLTVLRPGTNRDSVIAELGAPVYSEPFESGKKEIYTFVQGYGKVAKTGRALFHGTADVFSLGLWEAVGTPLEGAFEGKKISVRVVFDQHDHVQDSTTLSVDGAKI